MKLKGEILKEWWGWCWWFFKEGLWKDFYIKDSML